MFYSLATEKTSIEDSLSIFIAIAPCTLITNTEHTSAQVGADYYWWVDKFATQFDVQHVHSPGRISVRAKYELCYWFDYLCDLAEVQRPKHETREEFEHYLDMRFGSAVSIRGIKHFA